ncbi:MAG: hypothetical protein IJQ74_00955 [Synergistaceae bacterium]|nr:hypothetical protein [Synergistaceae bacterium]
MRTYFEGLLGNFRNVIRGEVSGSTSLVIAGLIALVIWFFVWTFHGWNEQSEASLLSQKGRFNTLLLLGSEYKSLSPSSSSAVKSGNVDVAAVFAQVSENMQLGSRVNRITPDGRNQSVELNRLYDEELVELQKQLSSRGVSIMAAELRALPAGEERLFTLSAIIGVK